MQKKFQIKKRVDVFFICKILDWCGKPIARNRILGIFIFLAHEDVNTIKVDRRGTPFIFLYTDPLFVQFFLAF